MGGGEADGVALPVGAERDLPRTMAFIINAPPHVYTGQGFDRATPQRKDERWLAERRRAEKTRVLLLAGLRVAVKQAERPELHLPSRDEAGVELDEAAVFLGLRDDAAIFAQQLGEGAPSAGFDFVELRSVSPVLSTTDASLAAYARALAHWHGRHRHCGACGAPTRSIDAGHTRRCSVCGLDAFPRTDPAVIMLVTNGDRCILGRSTRFKTGMYSTLAGFVEPGESLETAVAREVFEEVGVEVDSATYRSSQPWPFPQSLMLGFRATTRTETLRIELDELEDARWFSREELKEEASRPVQFPAPDSIARYLIEEWLAEG